MVLQTQKGALKYIQAPHPSSVDRGGPGFGVTLTPEVLLLIWDRLALYLSPGPVHHGPGRFTELHRRHLCPPWNHSEKLSSGCFFFFFFSIVVKFTSSSVLHVPALSWSLTFEGIKVGFHAFICSYESRQLCTLFISDVFLISMISIWQTMAAVDIQWAPCPNEHDESITVAALFLEV